MVAMMTMDNSELSHGTHDAHGHGVAAVGGCWSGPRTAASPTTASPPSSPTSPLSSTPMTPGRGGAGSVSVIRVHRHQHAADASPQSSVSPDSEAGVLPGQEALLGYPPGYPPGYPSCFAHPARTPTTTTTYPFDDVRLLGGLPASGTEVGAGRLVFSDLLEAAGRDALKHALQPRHPLRGALGGALGLAGLSWHGLGVHYPLGLGVGLGLGAPTSIASTVRASPATLKFGMDRILSNEGCGAAERTSRGDSIGCARLDCGSQLPSSLGELTTAYPGILAPTPLRIYGHVSDTRSSPSRISAQQLSPIASSAGGKRKRSWSRAVFSNLQRKGLEKRFQLQKYITKPDRRQLAATLGLTDAQVKVWFQNRRMKWRHTKESKQPTTIEETLDLSESDTPSITP